jgi:hypothetical protein
MGLSPGQAQTQDRRQENIRLTIVPSGLKNLDALLHRRPRIALIVWWVYRREQRHVHPKRLRREATGLADRMA